MTIEVGSTGQRIMTVNDVAEKYRVPVSWVYSRTRQTGPGSIPRLVLGKYLRFEQTEVDAWMRRQGKST